jgi:hypothetical protein
MKDHRSINTVIAISGMFLLIALAYGLDTWREFTSQYYSSTFSHSLEISWSLVIGNLLLSAAIVVWSWFVLSKVDIGKWACAIFICAGLLITIYPVLYFSPLGTLQSAYLLSPAFQVYLTSGIITMVGILKGIFVYKQGAG